MILICIQGGGRCIYVYATLCQKIRSLRQSNRDVAVSLKFQQRQVFALNADNARSKPKKSATDYLPTILIVLEIGASFQLWL